MSRRARIVPLRLRARTLLEGAHSGFSIGLAAGLVAAGVDSTYGALHRVSGGLVALVLSVFALLVPLSSASGAAFGAYLAPLLERARGKERFWASLATSSLAALPALLFALWVPSSWIAEHWEDMKSLHRALTLGALALVVASVLFAARVTYGLARRFDEGRLGSVWAILACALAGLIAAACYAADAVVFEGDYEDFHYGLAVGFVGFVALAFVVARALVRRRRSAPRGESRVRWLYPRLTPPLLAAALTWVAFAPATVFGRSSAIVFGKLLGTARALTDLDGDGYSSILGGGDCAPFDARHSPGRQEIPENGDDDDCSGHDAAWPVPPPHPNLAGTPQRWNVLLVSIDALRADHVGAYGYRRKTTPTLD